MFPTGLAWLRAQLFLRAYCLLLTLWFPAAPYAADGDDFRKDAEAIERLVNENYAYLDRFLGGVMPMTDNLRAEVAKVNTHRSLLRHAEKVLLLLADHHATTGSSLADSWAVVPSRSDLWIDKQGDTFVIGAVRDESPASQGRIKTGDRLIAIDGVPTNDAVAAFWNDLGAQATDERASFAARVLAAGRRDRTRRLTIQSGSEEPRTVELPNLYTPQPDRPPITASHDAAGLRIKINNSLGDSATIAAFDEAMLQARPKERVIVDLRETPSGGNTTVARAILGWFVNKPAVYQMHNLPREKRQTGIGRQWVEQVLPRGSDKYHSGPVVVLVGRWTGSMGEGLALGFAALNARVMGDRMAGLLGAIEDYRLPHSGLVLKLPTEQLFAVDGTPRENFKPIPVRAGLVRFGSYPQ